MLIIGAVHQIEHLWNETSSTSVCGKSTRVVHSQMKHHQASSQTKFGVFLHIPTLHVVRTGSFEVSGAPGQSSPRLSLKHRQSMPRDCSKFQLQWPSGKPTDPKKSFFAEKDEMRAPVLDTFS